ncbi:helix-hairpin-helix domain-containing protein [Bacteroidales bacterium OttesenSCG-928-B11]|nr:helix-hairpin-helix domain-containing protein [Bacteroidales bacterium OttesenSCG-928-E04]MDL2312011.1 helix-hairpin-helix domain-containing protein [Bacteroidales bacterium OttesenSCG-928-B11]
MRSFFRFSRGEWSAALLISIILLSSIILKQVYPKQQVSEPLSVHYQLEIKQFVEQQQQLTDSIQQRYALHKRSPNDYDPAKFSGNSGSFNSGLIPDDSVKRKPKTPGYAIVKIDLNRCDTSDITRIPLFGAKRAEKIVEYRERLGGFHSLAQLHEIYVIQNITPEHIEKYFSVNHNDIQKIAINTVEYADLVKHPYFDSYLAKTILQHRRNHGNITDLKHFQEITHAYQELMEKLEPYLAF